MKIIVVAKCICGNKREIKAGEIPKGDHPCCDKCGMPMIAEKAVRNQVAPHQRGGGKG